MVKLTLINRIRDALPLAEGLDRDKDVAIDQCKQQAKTIVKQLGKATSGQPQRCSVESGAFLYHYLISNGAVYLTMAEKGYPKKLAFQYLEELRKEFDTLYGTQIEGTTRPYAFIRFDTFIQRTKKLYLDTRTQRNIELLSQEVNEVHAIMTRNIQDVLGLGERLDRTQQNASSLADESKKYRKKTKDLYHQALLRKYMPIAALAGIILLVLWIRWRFY